jgi:hypothetical protein
LEDRRNGYTVGRLFALTNKASEAVRVATTGIAMIRSTGQLLLFRGICHIWRELTPRLAKSMMLGSEAMSMMDATNERWWEADVHRIAGDIALMSQQPNRPKAETHFEHALAVAREPRRSQKHNMNAPISSFSFSMGTARTVRTPPSSMAATIKGERRST